MEQEPQSLPPITQGTSDEPSLTLRPEFEEASASERIVAEEQDLQQAPSAEDTEPTKDLETFWTRLDAVFKKLQDERPILPALQDVLNQLPAQSMNNLKFTSVLYQPDRVSLNSQDDVNNLFESDQYYSNFRIRFARPILQAKSCQILRASIPTPIPNIPDSSLVFWYYKLPADPAYNNTLPYSINNLPFVLPRPQFLRFIRLSPSTVPPEIVGATYAQNRSFSDYQDLVNELNVACVNEPLFDKGLLPLTSGCTWQSGDISFEFDALYNKITMKGNNTLGNPPSYFYLPASYNDNNIFGRLQYLSWNAFYPYQQGDIVTYLSPTLNTTIPYFCIQNTVALWQAGNNYLIGQKVGYGRFVYIATVNIVNSQVPPSQAFPSWKVSSTGILPTNATYWTPYVPAANELNAILADPNQQLFNYVQTPCVSYTPPLVVGQTLNLRTGFTWNGSFQNYADLANLVRPVVANQNATPPTFSVFNFANTYPNLVNTSCVYVYADFINGSTQDSAGNGGLLCVVPLNTANNAVAFFQATINTPLLKIPSNLTEIQIRMLDENGLPFYLPDSAVVNLELQFTY